MRFLGVFITARHVSVRPARLVRLLRAQGFDKALVQARLLSRRPVQPQAVDATVAALEQAGIAAGRWAWVFPDLEPTALTRPDLSIVHAAQGRLWPVADVEGARRWRGHGTVVRDLTEVADVTSFRQMRLLRHVPDGAADDVRVSMYLPQYYSRTILRRPQAVLPELEAWRDKGWHIEPALPVFDRHGASLRRLGPVAGPSTMGRFVATLSAALGIDTVWAWSSATLLRDWQVRPRQRARLRALWRWRDG